MTTAPGNNIAPWFRKHWAGIATIAAIITALWGALYGIQTWVDSRVEDRISDPAFLRRLAERARPELIIDVTGAVLVDRGAMEFLDGPPQVFPSAEDPSMIGRISLNPKKYMAVAPVVSTVDGTSFALKAARGKGLSWEYTLAWSGTLPYPNPRPIRIEIIDR
ncbi:MAG TPA: hypothetical protein VG796_14215 [Verrucomicrobiales bacterium]|nr:hypothetical protein [Verrucomicrobiales bacterium]